MNHLPGRLAATILVSIPACAAPTPTNHPMPQESKNSVLQPAEMVGFLITTDAARARAFFEGKLGFRVTSEDAQALVLDADGRMLRIQKAGEHQARRSTVLGWNMPDLTAAVARLAAAGVAVERFPGLPLDENGIMAFPDGTRLAWFLDPDGNILSVAQMPGQAR